jgi:hypothetical protein
MASSAPATSAKVTVGVSFVTSFARDLPNCMTLLLPPCAAEKKNQKSRPRSRSGSRSEIMLSKKVVRGTTSLKPSLGFALSIAETTSAARADVVELHLRRALEGLRQGQVDALVAVGVRHLRDRVALRSVRPSCVVICFAPVSDVMSDTEHEEHADQQHVHDRVARELLDIHGPIRLPRGHYGASVHSPTAYPTPAGLPGGRVTARPPTCR